MVARPDALPSAEDVLGGARFLWSLPGFLRHPVGPEQVRAILRRRLERREADFLALVRRAVYEHRPSPYRQLLAIAGCEYGDLARLVGREGLEGALHTLYQSGVYLTAGELKGRRPTIRGSATIRVDPRRLRNPRATSHVRVQTGGSRGAPMPVPLDLRSTRDRALSRSLAIEARGGRGWVHGIWAVPGSSAIGLLLRYSVVGAPPARWFWKVDPSAPGLHPRYRWSARVLRWGSLLARVPLPRPECVPIEQPRPIARWMAGVLRSGRVPHLHTSASAVVRLCQAARELGIDFRGAQFTMTGEPITEVRLAAVREAGAAAVPSFSSIECGPVGYGCLAPEAPDDLHLFPDLHALIQPGAEVGETGLPARALLFSSLRLTDPLIRVNVSTGDQAEVRRRACGCPLERLGWATHLHTIRSFEKLTAGGMTFLDTDVVRVLEEVLPRRFGGGPTDYQLLEDEADDGRPRLRLLVHPAIGPVDEAAVSEAFLAAVGRGSGVERVMGLLWRDAGFVRVDRCPPRTTASGKILHLHVDRGVPART